MTGPCRVIVRIAASGIARPLGVLREALDPGGEPFRIVSELVYGLQEGVHFVAGREHASFFLKLLELGDILKYF